MDFLDQQQDQGRRIQVSPALRPAEVLARRVDTVLKDKSEQGPFVQVQVAVDEVDPVSWLAAQGQQTRLFWESREGDEYVAAVGLVDQLGAGSQLLDELKDALQKRLENASNTIRYYGGMRFDAQVQQDNVWPEFGIYSFILPRFEIRKHAGKHLLCCNLLLAEDRRNRDGVLEEIKALQFPTRALHRTCPMPVSRVDAPNENRWREVIEEALYMIRNGHALEKVVLARRVEFAFAEPFDKFSLFKLLRESTPQCFHFFVQLSDENAFLGAPPERLYKRSGRRIQSEAVAGTGKRDAANVKDKELGNALLLSDKDQREHAFVRRGIQEVFKGICESMQMDEQASLMELNMGRHLQSKIKGELKNSVSDIDILAQLSPTSAVGGHPQQDALETIRNLEAFDRGWYAGPVGWMSKDAAEFAVAIRSGLAGKQTLALYSGAGIVDGSKPEAEWGEIEQKLGDFIKALGLDQKGAKY